MGQDFVKMIKPLGCAICLIVCILVIAVCMTAGRDPIKGYTPPQDSAYYAEHLDELQAELEANVFPNVEGVVSSHIEGDVLAVEIQTDSFAVTRSALLYYFDANLFDLVRVE
jgi:hypothetical protein